LEALGGDARRHRGHAGHVSAGSREAVDESGCHRVAEREHDNRHRLGGAFGCLRARCGTRGDDIGFEPDAFGSERGEPLGAAPRGKVVDGDGLSRDVPEIAQALKECLEAW
jgi:hypothetical protein